MQSQNKQRKPSAYITFSTQNRDAVKRELNERGNSKPSMGDIAKLISKRWSQLSDREKNDFKQKIDREFEERQKGSMNANNVGVDGLIDDHDRDWAEKEATEGVGRERMDEENKRRNEKANLENGLTKDGQQLALPIARVKRIMKLDKSVKVVAADATKLITKATELFCEMLTQAAIGSMKLGKRKTIKYLDVERAVLKKAKFDFLHDHISAMKPKEGVPKKILEKELVGDGEDTEKAEVNTHGSRKMTEFFSKGAVKPTVVNLVDDNNANK